MILKGLLESHKSEHHENPDDRDIQTIRKSKNESPLSSSILYYTQIDERRALEHPEQARENHAIGH